MLITLITKLVKNLFRSKYNPGYQTRVYPRLGVMIVIHDTLDHGPIATADELQPFNNIWLSPSIKFAKCADLLSNGGILALYWNNYTLRDRGLSDLAQNVFRKHFPMRSNLTKSACDAQRDNIQARKDEIAKSGIFTCVMSNEVLRTVEFTVQEYIDLLRTISENAVLDSAITEPFYQDIDRCLSKNGVSVKVDILTNIEICKIT